MNVKISLFVVCIEAIVYLLLYDLHDCTFKLHTLTPSIFALHQLLRDYFSRL